MAKNPYSQGVSDGTAAGSTIFASVVPEPEYRDCVFDEASADATGTIEAFRTVGIIDASGFDSSGRVTVGVHETDASDGRQVILGILAGPVEDVDPSRSPNVDAPVSVIVGGHLWRSIVPDDDNLAAAARLVLEKKGKLRFEGGE